MYCPQCGAEYLRNVTVCTDCQVPLVAERPSKPDRGFDYGDEPLELVWAGRDPGRHEEALQRLDRESIPASTIRRADALLPIAHAPFEVYVPASLAERAKQILAEDHPSPDVADGPDDAGALELPAEDNSQEGLDNLRDPKDWHPEEATIEIWSGKDCDVAGMIAMSLKENEIPFRSSLDEAEAEAEAEAGVDAEQKFFVIPQDESRAREIVREIMSAAPPE